MALFKAAIRLSRLLTMPDLSSLRQVRDVLSTYDLAADKAFGQNFLVDRNVLQIIVETADISANDHVLEIGPGLGVLSLELAKRAAHVTAVELDERLLPLLKETFGDIATLNLVHADGLKFGLEQLPKSSLLVANLPYNVATPMIVRALEATRFKRLVFLVQKEVAERLTATPGSKAYGALSLVIRHFGAAERIKDVKPGSFYPPPEVTSSIVRIDVDETALPNPELFDFIHTSFRHRRKTLKKNLEMAGYKRSSIINTLETLHLDAKVRAEALALETFQALFINLSPYTNS